MPNRDERKKASDIFNESEFVFARKVTFDDAFPEIQDVCVEIKETGNGVWGEGTTVLKKGTIGEYVNCSNTLCYNGGVSIGSILREMVRAKQTELKTHKKCQGYEGSPKGMRKYRDCFNFFEIHALVTYKEQADSPPTPTQP